MASPVTIASSVGASMSAATGRSGQRHIVYAANQAAWWVFYLSSTQSLSALYSSGFGSWTAPSGNPFALTLAHGSEGRNYGFFYANIASTDVLYMHSGYLPSGGGWVSRFTLGTTWTNTNAEAQLVSTGANNPGGCVIALDSANIPYAQSDLNVSFSSAFWDGSHADSGTSWTAGFNGMHAAWNAGNYSQSSQIFSIGSGNLLSISTDAAQSATFTQLKSNVWSSGSFSGAVDVFGSTVTQTEDNNAGGVARTTSDIHFVSLSNDSNAYVHRRYNGSSWSAGDSIPTLAYGTLSGILLATDGTLVYAHVIDSSGNVQQTIWTSGTGWSAWTNVCSFVSHSRAYLSGYQTVVGGNIGLIWTEHNGSNYDIVGTLVPTSTASAGSAAVSGGTDTLASAGVFASPGALAKTEAHDTLAASAVFATAGAIAKTEAHDTLVALAPISAAALAKTEAHDTLAASGVLTTAATFSKTEAHDALVSAGTLATTAAASKTEAHDALAAAGALATAATVAKAEAHDTLAGIGHFTSLASPASVKVEWHFPLTTGPRKPTGFHVYIGTPSVSYASPAATVLYSAGFANTFQARLTGLTDGVVYQVGVRAYNTSAEESNVDVASVAADSTGPSPVVGLVGSAIV